MFERPAASTDDPDITFAIKERNENHAIAMIGCGGIAGVHLTMYRQAGFDVRALCDIDEQLARNRRDEFFPDAAVFTDHQEMLDSIDIDVVDITTPPEPRPALIRDALESGHHVLSQKPFVLDLDTGEELVTLAESQGCKLAVNQNARFSPDIGFARKAIEQDVLGRLLGIHVTRCWNYNRIEGDGISHRLLNHYVIHWLDMARWLYATEPKKVQTTLRRSPTQLPDQPIVGDITLEFDSGLATLTFDGNTTHGETYDLHIIGSDATITSRGPDLDTRSATLHRSGVWRRSVSLSGRWVPDGFLGTMEELLYSIEQDIEPMHSARDNLGTMGLVFAAIESARRDEAVVPGSVRAIPPS